MFNLVAHEELVADLWRAGHDPKPCLLGVANRGTILCVMGRGIGEEMKVKVAHILHSTNDAALSDPAEMAVMLEEMSRDLSVAAFGRADLVQWRVVP